MIDLDAIFFDKKLKKGNLFACRTDSGINVFYQINGDPDNRVLLRNFSNPSEYHRFLVEAFILRMSADRKSIISSRNKVRKLYNFLISKAKNSAFLLGVFLCFSLSACADLHVLKSSSEVDVGSGVVRCEYIRNGQISCVNFKGDIKNV